MASSHVPDDLRTVTPHTSIVSSPSLRLAGLTDQGVIAIRGRGTATVRWRECRGSERVCQCATVMSVRKLEEDSPQEALQHLAAPVKAQTNMDDPATHPTAPLVVDLRTAAYGPRGRPPCRPMPG